jgi:hypothetical protein
MHHMSVAHANIVSPSQPLVRDIGAEAFPAGPDHAIQAETP